MTLDLIEGGVCGIHYYTFNLERSTRLILEGAGLVNKTDYIKKNMPWRSVRNSLLCYLGSRVQKKPTNKKKLAKY